MEFKALSVPNLTEETASNLEILFDSLYGVERYTIELDTRQLNVVFDETQLSFQMLVQKMNDAGCSLRNINAALLLRAFR